MSDVHELERALRLTESMLEAARSGDWEQVSELERERRAHVQSAFEGPVSGGDAPVFAELAQRILTLDRELVAAGEQGRLTLAEALARLHNGQRAAQAYAAQYA
jgi:hypothetical protein